MRACIYVESKLTISERWCICFTDLARLSIAFMCTDEFVAQVKAVS